MRFTKYKGIPRLDIEKPGTGFLVIEWVQPYPLVLSWFEAIRMPSYRYQNGRSIRLGRLKLLVGWKLRTPTITQVVKA